MFVHQEGCAAGVNRGQRAEGTPKDLANVCFHTLSLLYKSKTPLCAWPRAINTQVWVALFTFRRFAYQNPSPLLAPRSP